MSENKPVVLIKRRRSAACIWQPGIILALWLIAGSAWGDPVKCNLITYPFTFNNFYPTDATIGQGTGSVAVQCTNNQNISVMVVYSLNCSAGSSGNSSSRQAVQGANNVLYNIYIDSGDTEIFDGVAANTYSITDGYVLSAHSSQTLAYPLYGSVPVQAFAVPQTYTDTLTITLTYYYYNGS